MLDYWMKGGVLMIPLLLCSIVSMAIVLERLYVLFRAKRNGLRLWTSLEGLLRRGDWEAAVQCCQDFKKGGPLGRLVLQGLESIAKDPLTRKEELQALGVKEIKDLERHLWLLSLIADIAPLLGLLGTVTGMVKAFITIQEMEGRVNASLLAGGIWEALITTVAGLSIAIPTMVAYHYLERRVTDFSDFLKETASQIWRAGQTQG
jgi:biopolymer transport protein ExbB